MMNMVARRPGVNEMIYGWGINDSDYDITWCPIFQCWQAMIMRCHCSHTQVRQRTYVGCKVDERWKHFMAFRAWYLEQDPKPGDQLDKDYLGDGKLYSPETCCFVSQLFNSLFNNHRARRGSWPQGVSKVRGRYQAEISCKGKRIYLGYFDTPKEASAAYLKAKAAYVEELLAEFPQTPRLAVAIRRKMAELIERESTWTYLTVATEQPATSTSSQTCAP